MTKVSQLKRQQQLHFKERLVAGALNFICWPSEIHSQSLFYNCNRSFSPPHHHPHHNQLPSALSGKVCHFSCWLFMFLFYSLFFCLVASRKLLAWNLIWRGNDGEFLAFWILCIVSA